MLTPNTILQRRYRIIRSIGEGGMGAVYEAFDERLTIKVALKRMTGNSAYLHKAFQREARTLAMLRHNALPKVIDFFSDPAGQCLVMEFIPGHDLGEQLELRDTPFPLDTVLAWADVLLDALEYLHSHQPPIIHRDIKPQNVKVTPGGHIYLLDFGLAKGIMTQHTHMKNPASVLTFTQQYAPLEQIRGTSTGPYSDLYSLSATLYHLLTKVPPPDALNRADALVRGRPDSLRSIQRYNDQVPASVSAVVLKGLALDPDKRPASARDMRRVLTQARSDDGSATVRFAAVGSKASKEQVAFSLPAWLPLGIGGSTVVIAALLILMLWVSSASVSVQPPRTEFPSPMQLATPSHPSRIRTAAPVSTMQQRRSTSLPAPDEGTSERAPTSTLAPTPSVPATATTPPPPTDTPEPTVPPPPEPAAPPPPEPAALPPPEPAALPPPEPAAPPPPEPAAPPPPEPVARPREDPRGSILDP